MGIAQRLEHVRQALLERKLDAILVIHPENCRYLSGFTGSNGTAGALLISQESGLLATDFIHFEQAKQEAPDFDLMVVKPGAKKFAQLLDNQPLRNVGFEATALSYAEWVRLADAARDSGIQTEPVEGLVESLRAVKEADEIASIENAARIADGAIEVLSSVANAGMTEKEVAWILETYLRENGSDHVPFEIIVASGTNAALPHAKPTSRVIGYGEPIVCDFGARVDGYVSDVSRTFWVGPPDEKFSNIYDLVLAAQTKAIDEAKAGMQASEVDRLARTLIDNAGYAQSFGHGLGHGVGLAVHEAPRLGPGSTDRIVDNMVFTIEPGIYISGWGGVRIEDTVVMEKGSLREITLAPKFRGTNHA